MARTTLVAGLLLALLASVAIATNTENAWRRNVRKHFHDSLDSLDVGSAPGGGANFQIIDADEMGPQGDGVMTLACLNHWMRHAMQVNINAGTANPVTNCPFGPFGAAIVDAYDTDASNVHVDGANCGKLLETNSGLREVNIHNPMMHSEINAIFRLTDCTLHPTDCDATGKYLNAQNKTFWQRLYLFTTAASCPADAASETLAGIKTVVQAVTVRDLLNWGWTQDSFFEPELIYSTSRQNNGVATLIKGVEREYIKQYFSWQFNNVAFGCPTGCAVTINNGARSCSTVASA